MSAASRRLPGRILALTPGDADDATAGDVLRRARAAVGAGLDSILLREPALSDRATLALAVELRALLGPRGWLGVHDRVHVAATAGADAVHLGFRSLPIDAARAILPDGIAIGFSAHAADDPAAWAGADYLVFGPVHATPSKAGLLPPTGVAGLARAVAASAAPVWALGGIDASNAAAIAPTGARGIAARGALLCDSDPRAAWQRLSAARSWLSKS